MLWNALANGPTWYRDYGLYGMQYGGRQVTTAVRRQQHRRRRALLPPPRDARATHARRPEGPRRAFPVRNGRIQNLFDGDPLTLARTLDANPSVVRLTFTHGLSVRGIVVSPATMRPRVRIAVLPVGRRVPLIFTASLPRKEVEPTLTLPFGRPVRAKTIDIRVRDLDALDVDHVHVREIHLE